jgi:hypothetical protein
MAELSTEFMNALYVAKIQCNIFNILGLVPHLSYPILKPDLKQNLQLRSHRHAFVLHITYS